MAQNQNSAAFAQLENDVLTEQVCSLHLAAMRDNETPEEVPLRALAIREQSNDVRFQAAP